MKARHRFEIVLLLSLLVVAGFGVYSAMEQGSPVELVSSMRGALLLRAWLPFFFDHLSVAVAVAAVITFSLLLSPYDLSGADRLLPAARSILLVVLMLGLINALWFGLLGSRVERRLERIRYHSAVVRQAETLITTTLDSEDPGVAEIEMALDYARLRNELLGEDERARSYVGDLERALAEARREADTAPNLSPVGAERLVDVPPGNSEELIRRARESLNAGNYYAAHYYADRAVAIREREGVLDEGLLRLRSAALNGIEDGIQRANNEEDRSFFDRKLAAYLQLRRGTPEAVIAAYYRFRGLYEERSSDPDVQRYLAEADELRRQVSFDGDEAARYEAFADRGNLVFSVPTQSGRALIAAGSMVRSPAGEWFYSVEVMWLPRNANLPLLHVSSRYAKRVNDYLVLRYMESDDVSGVVEPRVLAGSLENIEDPALISLQSRGEAVETEDIEIAGAGTAFASSLSIAELLSLPEARSALGQAVVSLRVELVSRFVRIVGLFIVAFLSIAWAWRFRSLYLARPPVIVFVALPFLPAAVWWLLSVGRSVVVSAVQVTVQTLPPAAAIGVTLGVLLLGLMYSVAVLARQTVRP